MINKNQIEQITELFKALSDPARVRIIWMLGKQMYYKLTDDHVRQVLEIGMEHVKESRSAHRTSPASFYFYKRV